MALSVWPLGGFPAINTALQRSAGTPTDTMNPATGSYTAGVYTAPANTYVAGILDQQGVNPSRIYFSDNNTGGGTTGATVNLPQLVTITQVSAHGQSLQELPTNYVGGPSYNEAADAVGYAGFLVVLNATPAAYDDGLYPLGFNNAISGSGAANFANTPGWTSQGGNYSQTVGVTVNYPNPQMRYYVTLNAMLIIASTATG